jgi:hypothetical protein
VSHPNPRPKYLLDTYLVVLGRYLYLRFWFFLGCTVVILERERRRRRRGLGKKVGDWRNKHVIHEIKCINSSIHDASVSVVL